jgi:hypothetical protein
MSPSSSQTLQTLNVSATSHTAGGDPIFQFPQTLHGFISDTGTTGNLSLGDTPYEFKLPTPRADRLLLWWILLVMFMKFSLRTYTE